MVCQNCGYEIPDGKLLCEKCGSEINIVPDFDIEVENSISETLSTIVDEISPDGNEKSNKEISDDVKVSNKNSKKSKDKRKSKKKESIEEEFFKDELKDLAKNISKRGIIITVALVFITVTVLFAVFFFLYSNTSVKYQVNKAYKEADKGNFDIALEYIDKSILIERENLGLFYEKANILFIAGRSDEALDICQNYIGNKKLDDENAIKFYGLLINIYSSLDKYDEINNELIISPYDAVKEKYSDYMALAPVFSIPTGSYEAETVLKIDADINGSIYYTTDGISPSKEHGDIYTVPLVLEKGEYDIKAVYINQYGISSEITSGYYLIDVTVPEPPVVKPESGKYTSEFSIVATAINQNDIIYYTEDGSEPDEVNGLIYQGPIKPPIGKSNYAFVAVSEDGIKSEIVRRSYDFELQANISYQDSILYLMNSLHLCGHLADTNGAANDGIGIYSYYFDSVIEISGYGYYYSLSEFYTDDLNATVETINKYAVNPYTGEGYYLIVDDQGNINLIPLLG